MTALATEVGQGSLTPDVQANAASPASGLADLVVHGLGLIDRHYRAVVAGLAVLAVILVTVAMRGGIGVTPDSVGYTSAARSFALDGTFTYFDGHPLVLWPIGYPLALGVGIRLGLSVTAVGFLIDIVSVAALIALSAALSRRAAGSRVLAVGVAAAVGIAVTTVHNYTELWSEPLFITACLAAVLFMMDIAARGPRTSRLVGAVLFVWLASNLRFVGVTLVPVVGVALLASTWRRPTLRSFVFAAGATGIAFAGTLFVFARNEMVGGTAAGSWNPSNASIGDLVQTTLVTAGHWLLPTAVPSLLAGLAIAVIAAYGAVILIRDPASRQPAAPLIAYVVVYVGVLVAIESRVDGHIDERYLAPVLVPALILVAVGLRDAWRRAVHARVTSGSAGRGRQLAAAAVAGVVLLAVVGYAGVNTITSVRFAALRGPVRSGYNSDAARRSTLAEAAANSETISNDPEHTYWITGHFPTYAPRSFARYGEDAKAALLAKVRSGAVTEFIEFNEPQSSGGWQATDLRSWGIRLSDPRAYPDGTLYHLSIPSAAG